jgi:hypothetical protein
MRDDWTSVSDFEKSDPSRLKEYLSTEDLYWQVTKEFLCAADIAKMEIKELEIFDISGRNITDLERNSTSFVADIGLTNGMVVDLSTMEGIFRAALRECVWCKIIGKQNTFVHFGYDYYVYLGSDIADSPKAIPGIFVEKFVSPYSE